MDVRTTAGHTRPIRGGAADHGGRRRSGARTGRRMTLIALTTDAFGSAATSGLAAPPLVSATIGKPARDRRWPILRRRRVCPARTCSDRRPSRIPPAGRPPSWLTTGCTRPTPTWRPRRTQGGRRAPCPRNHSARQRGTGAHQATQSPAALSSACPSRGGCRHKPNQSNTGIVQRRRMDRRASRKRRRRPGRRSPPRRTHHRHRHRSRGHHPTWWGRKRRPSIHLRRALPSRRRPQRAIRPRASGRRSCQRDSPNLRRGRPCRREFSLRTQAQRRGWQPGV